VHGNVQVRKGRQQRQLALQLRWRRAAYVAVSSSGSRDPSSSRSSKQKQLANTVCLLDVKKYT
jgi:hypothetical protein